jgi:NADP-dependent 3-hydroxy acid dehydrogenase YdfG
MAVQPREMMMSVDKVIAVTGASSGIGEAIARLLADRGARVVIGARRADHLETLAAELNAAGGRVVHCALDVTRRASVADFVQAAVKSFGRLDVIVNNAGIMPLSPISALKVEEWNRMIDVNVKGVLHGIAAALPVFRSQGSGHVINTSSIGAYHVVPTAAVYCATKAAVNFITEGLRQESPDIRCTIISPGVTQSDLASTITHRETAAFIADYRRQAIPADAIARAVAFAIEQPDDVDVSEIVVRPTASSN